MAYQYPELKSGIYIDPDNYINYSLAWIDSNVSQYSELASKLEFLKLILDKEKMIENDIRKSLKNKKIDLTKKEIDSLVLSQIPSVIKGINQRIELHNQLIEGITIKEENDRENKINNPEEEILTNSAPGRSARIQTWFFMYFLPPEFQDKSLVKQAEFISELINRSPENIKKHITAYKKFMNDDNLYDKKEKEFILTDLRTVKKKIADINDDNRYDQILNNISNDIEDIEKLS